MPPPLAPYFVLGYLASIAGGPILAEPRLDAGFRELGEENPLLGCVY